MTEARKEFKQACDFYFDDISPSMNRLCTAATRMHDVGDKIEDLGFTHWLSTKLGIDIPPDATFGHAATLVLQHLGSIAAT